MHSYHLLLESADALLLEDNGYVLLENAPIPTHTGELTALGYGPTIINPVAVPTFAGDVALTAYAPAVVEGLVIGSATGDVVFTGYDISFGSNVSGFTSIIRRRRR